MKYLLILIVPHISFAYVQKFCYPEQNLNVSVDATNIDEAFRKAAKLCFKVLTKDKYQGEEKSLDIIDICVNPKRCN